MPGYERYRISDNTVMLVADSPLAPNRSTQMLFVPEDLDTTMEGEPVLQGDADVCGPFDGDDSVAALPSIMMRDPRLSFAQSLIGGQVPILSTLVLDLPQIPLADLPDEFEAEVDCETSPSDPEPMTGESVGELEGITDGVTVGVTEGVTVDIDSVEIDDVPINSADFGLPLPANLFPIELEVDTELEGELEGDIDDSFIEFIPMITGGSVGFNDKIEIKMHYDGDPGDATISPRAVISAPLGTSCFMNIKSVQEDAGLPLPFTFDSALELPAGESTIRIEPQCETDVCYMTFDDLFMQIETSTTSSVIPDCLISDIAIDGVSLDIPQIPLPPRGKVDALEGTGSVTMEDSTLLVLELVCESPPQSIEGEVQLRADGDTVGVTDAIVIVIGEDE
jgi:hypothetical protein